MKDKITIESINSVRSRLLEKAAPINQKNPLSCVEIVDKNGKHTHVWKNLNTGEEVPREHWTPEMIEEARRKTAELLAAGPKKASRAEIDKIKNKTEGKKKKQTVREKTIAENTSKRAFEAKQIADAKAVSDDDLIKQYHESGDREALNTTIWFRAKDIFNKLTGSSHWHLALSEDDRNDVFSNVVTKLIGGQTRKTGENKGQAFEHVVGTFEKKRAEKQAQGKSLNFEQHLVTNFASALTTALQEQQRYNKLHDSLDAGTGSDADADEAKEAGRKAEKSMGSDSSMDADAAFKQQEKDGLIRQKLLQGLNSPTLRQEERLVVMAAKLKGKSMEEIGKWFFPTAKDPAKAASKVYQSGLEHMRDAMGVVKKDGTGRATHYTLANGEERPDYEKAYSEFLYGLEKAFILGNPEFFK